MQGFWKFLSDRSTAISSIIALAATAWGIWKVLLERWWKGRLRIELKVFEVITDLSLLLPKLFAAENDNSLLADHRITYQPRDPNHDIQAELRKTLNGSRYLLITAPTGYGKTREATVLAQSMMLEGWRVLRIKTGWLDAPKELPAELSGSRLRVLILLDDLNGLFSTGGYTQSPRAEQMPIFSQESYHDRLLRVLDAFEEMCTEDEIRVIATARSEAEQWKLLDYDINDKLWNRFERIEIPEPKVSAIVGLLYEMSQKAALKSNPRDFESIARRNDGSYRNIVLNLRRWRAQDKEIDKDDMTDSLNGSWQDVYQRAAKKYIAVKYIYGAIDVLQQAGIALFPFMVVPTAQPIWAGNGLQRFFRQREINIALNYLTRETSITTTFRITTTF